jgi:ATP-binding cassette subfamily B protein
MPLPMIKGEIEFNGVCYHYPGDDKPVVSDFTLSVDRGERIAVVGASGSGKSTLMNLIIGLLSPTSGEIIVDGVPLSQMPMQAYRRYLSVVPQNSILFSGTIRENITYGMEKYSEAELNQVIEQANLRELIDSLPDGLESQIGEHGDKLSGGQKQRITIARALLRRPKILILDGATSALDNVSEYHVQKAISASVKGKTTFIVAHRLSTIRNADRIVVMENGVAVEMGTYDELMEKKGRFYELKSLNDFNQKVAEEALM